MTAEIIAIAVVIVVLLALIWWWWPRAAAGTSAANYPDIGGVWGIMHGDTLRQHVTMERIDNGRFKMTADDSHDYSVLSFDDSKHITVQPKNADGGDRGVPLRAFLLSDTTLIVGGDEALGWGNGTVYHRVSFVKK